MSEDRLRQTALCLEWAEPVGGLGPLAGPTEPVGGLARLLRRVGGRGVGDADLGSDPAAYAEAERLAASIARIAHPGMRVQWATVRNPAGGQGAVTLDRRLLDPRPDWDLPHRVDALMGMTLRDAAHAERTPPTFHDDLAVEATRTGLLDDRETGEPPEDAGNRLALLIALFLVVEAWHVDAWIAESFPGFRGYLATYWLWRIPSPDVVRRLTLPRGRASFGAIVDVAVALLAGRAALAQVPERWRPLFEAIDVLLHQVDHDSPPGLRYAAAIALYRLLRESISTSAEPHERERQGAAPGGAGEQVDAEQQRDSRNGDESDAIDRQDALDAFMAIALNGLDPDTPREGLTPEQQRTVDGLNGEAAHRRGAGRPARPDVEETSFVAHRRLTFEGARPMHLITPAITTGARMRYDATHARMRGQIDALRQVLKFRLAERRHAVPAQTSGQLDEQALYRLAASDERVFMRRAIESAPDQDLCILLDESASMGPGQVHVRATIVLFHHALHGLPGVRHWVFGFSGYGRGIALYRYISPSRADLQRPQRLGAVSSREATPLAEAVAGAADAMLAEGQGRDKLMIVVTDGHPDDVDGARRALRAAESRGVSILGLGIAADAAAAGALFSHFTLYQDVASLPRKVGGLLRRVVGVW